MDWKSTNLSTTRAAVAWRVAAIVQGVVVAGAATAGLFWALSTELAPVRAPEGPAIAVQEVTLHPSIDRGVPGVWTFYIVGSELEGRTFREAIALGNNIRYDLGLDMTREEVLVVTSAAEAISLVECIDEGNRILAGFGVEDRVVNLVT